MRRCVEYCKFCSCKKLAGRDTKSIDNRIDHVKVAADMKWLPVLSQRIHMHSLIAVGTRED